jgi:hypothetical protein
LPTCCEQRVTYLVIGISDLELESTFLEQKHTDPVLHGVQRGADSEVSLLPGTFLKIVVMYRNIGPQVTTVAKVASHCDSDCQVVPDSRSPV